MEIEPAKIVLLAIFGSGLVTACGYALARIIRAAHGAPESEEELKEQIAGLEDRVSHLESLVKRISEEQLVG